MTKPELRQQLRTSRQSLTAAQVTAKSHAITERIIASVDWSSVFLAHCYQAISGSNEVDTSDLESWLKAHGVEVTHPGKFLTTQELETPFDLIIVPLLGFDRQRHRLGYGGGFYDRFLPHQPQAYKLGVGYELSLVPDGIPIAPYDVPLDSIYTEITIY